MKGLISMHNNLTKEEIKNSVECQWRKFHAKQLLVIYLIIAAATLFVPLILLMQYGMEYLGQGIITWLICILVLGLFFGGFVLYYYSKYRYLLKNYRNFNCHEVVLDNVATSYSYRAIYYTVTFNHNGKTKKVHTNPYFSNTIFSKFSPEEYNNKKVIGLYDDNLERFYIIRKTS